jgi:uncharacterized protein (DUF488 family)
MRAIYEAHLDEPEAQSELTLAAELAERRPCALLCYEADARRCHRAIVGTRVHERVGCEIVDL